jgi:hypothetical protein
MAVLYDFSAALPDPVTIDWDSEVPLVIEQRLAAVVQRIIRDFGLEPPDHIVGKLQDAVFAWVQASCIASKKATDDLVALDHAKIEYVVLKGPGIAVSAKHISERPFTDIDIFVRKESFGQAISILEKLGYAEEDKNLLPWQGLNRYCREAVNLRTSSGGSIDVHHQIPPWYWGSKIDFQKLHDRSVSIVAPCGGRLPCASPTDNLLISALHIVSDKNRPGSNLMAWRDFLLLVRTCNPGEVVALARDAQLCGWLSWIIDALPDHARPAKLADALRAENPRIPGQFRLSMLLPPKIGSRHLIGQVFRLPIPNAALYLVGMTWPSSTFLRTKISNSDHRRSTWWRSGMTVLNDQRRLPGASHDPEAPSNR